MTKQTVKLLLVMFLAVWMLVGIGQEVQNQHNKQYRAEHAITIQEAREMGWSEPQ